MEAKLIYCTPDPLMLIWHAYHHEKHNIFLPPWPFYPKEEMVENDEMRKEALDLLLEGWGPFLELPQTVWSFRVPRALHAQMRVHRHWSCWSQSHQLHEPSTFASIGKDYWMPSFEFVDTEDVDLARERFRSMMLTAEEHYAELRQFTLPSIARLVLPQAINLGLTCGINLRALTQTAIHRRCHIFQGTLWNPLLDLMCEQLTEVDPMLKKIFQLQPCDLGNRCLSAVEQEQRVTRQDPHAVCPRYKELVKSKGMRNCCDSGCEGCLKFAVKARAQVKRSVRY